MSETVPIIQIQEYGYTSTKPKRTLYEWLSQGDEYWLLCEAEESQWAAACLRVVLDARSYKGRGTDGNRVYAVQLRAPMAEEGSVFLRGTINDHFFRFDSPLQIKAPTGGTLSLGYFVPPGDWPTVTIPDTLEGFPNPDPENPINMPRRDIV